MNGRKGKRPKMGRFNSKTGFKFFWVFFGYSFAHPQKVAKIKQKRGKSYHFAPFFG